MSSSVEREDEGRGATDFFRMGLGRLQGRERGGGGGSQYSQEVNGS